jgi:hypothetical protein
VHHGRRRNPPPEFRLSRCPARCSCVMGQQTTTSGCDDASLAAQIDSGVPAEAVNDDVLLNGACEASVSWRLKDCTGRFSLSRHLAIPLHKISNAHAATAECLHRPASFCREPPPPFCCAIAISRTVPISANAATSIATKISLLSTAPPVSGLPNAYT